jgi:hypothetical protein
VVAGGEQLVTDKGGPGEGGARLMQAKFLCTVCIRRTSRRDSGSHRVLFLFQERLSILQQKTTGLCLVPIHSNGAARSRTQQGCALQGA